MSGERIETKWLDFYYIEGNPVDLSDKIKSDHRGAYLLTRNKKDGMADELTLYYIDEAGNRLQSEIPSQTLASKSLFADFLAKIDSKEIAVSGNEMVNVNDQLEETVKIALNNKLKQPTLTERPLAIRDQLAYEFTKFNIQKVKDHFESSRKNETGNNVITAGPLKKSDETWAMEMLLEALLRENPADPITFDSTSGQIIATYRNIEYNLNQILPYVNWSQIRRFSEDPVIQQNYRNFLLTDIHYKPDRPAKKIPGMWGIPDPTNLNAMPASESEMEDQKLYISPQPVRKMVFSKKRIRKHPLVINYQIKRGDKIEKGHISIKKLRTLMKKYDDQKALSDLDGIMQKIEKSEPVTLNDWRKVKSYIFHFTPITGSRSEYLQHILDNIEANDTQHDLSHLKDAEKIALNIYSSNAAYDMNNLLRGNTGELLVGVDKDEKNNAIAELLRHIAIATPACYANEASLESTNEPKTYVRRMEVGPGKEHLLKDILEKAEAYKMAQKKAKEAGGEEKSGVVHRVPEAAFQSTTTDQSKYTNILEKKYVAVMFVNDMPGVNNVQGVNIRALSIYPEEIEYLLAPGIGGLVYEDVVETDDSYIVLARIVDTPTDLPRPATPLVLNKDVEEYKIEQQFGSLQAYYLSRTDEEQYANNIKAWKTFLSEDPAINPYCKDEGYKERQDTMRKFFALMDYLGMSVEDISHGGRLRFQSEDIEAIMEALTRQNNVIQPRLAASHKTSHDKNQNEYKERKLRGGLAAVLDVHHYASAFIKKEHLGMDIGVSAQAKASPADGSHGHVYLNVFRKKGSKKGAFMVGVEGSAPRKINQFGEWHGTQGASNALSATGATKKSNDQNKKQPYVRPDEPFIRIDNTAEALAYIESSYRNIEDKWQSNLHDEEQRVAAIKINRELIETVEMNLTPKWDSEYSTSKLSHLEIHAARASRIMEMTEVSNNSNTQSLVNAKTKNQAMIADLEQYLEIMNKGNYHYSAHHKDFVQKAESKLKDLRVLNEKIDECLSAPKKDVRSSRYITAERAFTSSQYEEAVKKKNEYLGTSDSLSCSVEIRAEPEKTVITTTDQYAVVSSRHGKVESVTIHSRDKNSDEVYFKDPARAEKAFRSDRQSKRGSNVTLSFLPKLGTSIPNQTAMAWAADTIDAFLRAHPHVTQFQCKGATREQAESIQIYAAFLARQNPAKPISCRVLSKFEIDEATLNRKVDLYINLNRKDVMLHKSMEMEHGPQNS